MASSPPRFIDVHHHCVLPEYQAALVRAGAADPSRPLRKNASPQEAIDSMGTLGIEAAIVNPLSVAGVHHGNDEHARYLCRSVGDALARFAGHAPGTLGFFAPLPWPDIDGSLRELEYALDTLKADGIILLSNQNGIYVGDKRMEPLLAELNRRKAVVFVHPARPTFVDTLTTKIWGAIIEYTFETTRVATYLIYNEFMKRFPDIRWILAHAGGCLPYVSFRLILMEEQDINEPAFSRRVPEGARAWIDRFYFDTAISGSAPALAALSEVARPGHVLYGSDWPYIDRHTIELQHECLATWKGLDDGTRAAINRENALALFPRFRR
jgi:predicted TIM-barrel fold metal-dependent hydrolase